MEDIHFFGIDESSNQLDYTKRNGRPFTVVLCHSTYESEILPSKLEKRRFFDRSIFNTDFIYTTRTNIVTGKDYVIILSSIIKEGISRFCEVNSNLHVYVDQFPHSEEKLMNKLKKEIYDSINKSNFFLCFDKDNKNPLINRADHLAGIISYYKSSNIKHKERQKNFRDFLPNLDDILAKHEINL